ncbi:MAG TPA: DUF1127 domain-containing protein [Paracoccaceae bacterium]|nr:DUF1127 domain-containing protein [Paracoccaceae bacterium]
MSYIDRHRPAPFGAVTAHRATSAIGEFATGLRRLATRRYTTLAALSPAALEDIGLSVADVPARRRPGVFARAVAAIRDWDARRRTVAELERLSDTQLADIGLLRAHIDDLRRGRPLV